MTEFIKEYYPEIVSAALFIAAAVIFYRKDLLGRAKAIALSLVAAAEEKWGSGTGEIKYAEVVMTMYEKLPGVAKVILSPAALSKIIEDAVAKLKEILKN